MTGKLNVVRMYWMRCKVIEHRGRISVAVRISD